MCLPGRNSEGEEAGEQARRPACRRQRPGCWPTCLAAGSGWLGTGLACRAGLPGGVGWVGEHLREARCQQAVRSLWEGAHSGGRMGLGYRSHARAPRPREPGQGTGAAKRRQAQPHRRGRCEVVEFPKSGEGTEADAGTGERRCCRGALTGSRSLHPGGQRAEAVGRWSLRPLPPEPSRSHWALPACAGRSGSWKQAGWEVPSCGPAECASCRGPWHRLRRGWPVHRCSEEKGEKDEPEAEEQAGNRNGKARGLVEQPLPAALG